MARQFAKLEQTHIDFIARQRVFFIASAAANSRVNLSPKSMDEFRVLDANAVIYRDLTGSGNETAAHVRAHGGLTIMFCAFESKPLILRLYGRGHVLNRGTTEYATLLRSSFEDTERLGARQMIAVDIELVQTSCGFGVPLFDFVGERPTLDRWAQTKGDSGLNEYRREKNENSIDGIPTGLFDTPIDAGRER